MDAMQTFVILMKFMSKGAETLDASSQRYARFEEGIQELGGKILSAYGLLGRLRRADRGRVSRREGSHEDRDPSGLADGQPRARPWRPSSSRSSTPWSTKR